jgi:transposase
VHWPDDSPAGAPVAWAGGCWAVEAELSPKTVARTVAIMREILTRTGDYGCPAAEASVPGRAPRHARALYLCSPAALSTVLRARNSLGPLAARVEVRDLPPGALLS